MRLMKVGEKNEKEGGGEKDWFEFFKSFGRNVCGYDNEDSEDQEEETGSDKKDNGRGGEKDWEKSMLEVREEKEVRPRKRDDVKRK